MPRRARLVLPDVPVHVIQRGNNRGACFHSDEDFRRYLEWLSESAQLAACRIHAYVLMTNHVHLLLTPATADGPGRMMKALGQRYAQYVNRVYGRTGTLWEGRFRSCLVESERYLLACQRYIELNPVRAGMVGHPGSYRWSSYRCSGEGHADPCLVPHPAYVALGESAPARQSAYRALVADALCEEVVEAIRSATNGNFALGGGRFAADVAAALGRRAMRGRPGRPPQKRVRESLKLSI